jgi:integrase
VSALRVVTELDEERANIIHLWRNRFSAPSTRRTMWSALLSTTRIVRSAPESAAVNPAQVEWEVFADLIAFEWLLRRIDDAVSPATARKYRSAVTSLLRYFAAGGLVRPDVLEATLLATQRRRQPTDRREAPAITSHDLSSILHACRTDPHRITGARDAALIAVAAGTGARREEVTRLTRTDIDMESRRVTFALTKGGGARHTLLPSAVTSDVDSWLRVYEPLSHDPLFPAVRKGGAIEMTPLSGHQFWKRVTLRAAEAGLSRKVTPHDFRRWYVTSLLEGGHDIFTVMRTVGHRHPSTTQIYDRRPTERLRSVVDSLAI